jgi:hypothetical protein
MTLEQVADSLPNGFHDAQVEELVWNFQTSSASFSMQLWVAEDEDFEQKKLEVYRPARLQVTDIVFMAFDPPSAEGPYPTQWKPGYDALIIDGMKTEQKWFPPLPALVNRMSAGTEVYSFYVNDWNSFIHIAAKEAKLTWLGERTTRAR